MYRCNSYSKQVMIIMLLLIMGMFGVFFIMDVDVNLVKPIFGWLFIGALIIPLIFRKSASPSNNHIGFCNEEIIIPKRRVNYFFKLSKDEISLLKEKLKNGSISKEHYDKEINTKNNDYNDLIIAFSDIEYWEVARNRDRDFICIKLDSYNKIYDFPFNNATYNFLVEALGEKHRLNNHDKRINNKFFILLKKVCFFLFIIYFIFAILNDFILN